MRTYLQRIAATIVVTAAISVNAAQASNAIERVEFSQLSGRMLVKVSLHDALTAEPSSFSVAAPPRIAFDFQDTENTTGNNTISANTGILRSINVVQAGERTRMVLNLAAPSQYATRIEGNNLFIDLGPLEKKADQGSKAQAATTTSAPAQAPTAPPAANFSAAPPSITQVDFQPSGADLATIKVDVSDPSVVFDVQKQGNSGLAVVLSNATVPQRLIRRLDVKDFGTPVTQITTTKTGKGSQILLSNHGDWDYNVRQLDTTIIIEVRKIIEDPRSVSSAKEVQGKVVSFNFTQPVPVSQMIGLFQDITGLNFVVMPGVGGEIQSLKMDNTPVKVAIDVISRMYGLGFRRYGGIVVVGKADDLAKYDKEERDRAAALESTEPIEQDSMKIRYRSAAEVVQMLIAPPNAAPAGGTSSNGMTTSTVTPSQPTTPAAPAAGQNSSGISRPLISSRGSISFDSVTNTVFIEETRTQLEKIRQRIQTIDRPVQQVMIEARIVTVKDSFSKSLGVKLNFLRAPNNGTLNGTINGLSPLSPSGITGVSAPRGGPANMVSGGFNATTGSDLMFSLFNSNQTRLLNLELTANENDGLSKSVATPKVLTQNGRQATITSGQNICFQMSTANTITTQCIDAATKLDVTPQINPDERIQLKVYVNKGKPSTNAGNVAVVSTEKNEITTNVIVENGGTLMLGGLFADDTSNNVTQVPLLGDIPILGNLFKQTSKTRDKNELLIFITPRIVTSDLVLQ